MITKALDLYGNKSENMILVGDLNTVDTVNTEHFLSNCVTFPAYFKSVEKPNSIYLMITTKTSALHPSNLQNWKI